MFPVLKKNWKKKKTLHILLRNPGIVTLGNKYYNTQLCAYIST